MAQSSDPISQKKCDSCGITIGTARHLHDETMLAPAEDVEEVRIEEEEGEGAAAVPRPAPEPGDPTARQIE